MKLRLIGCAVMRHEIEALLEQCPNEVDCEWLPQGLHAVPRTLQRDLQEAVDRVAADAGYQAILIGYGLCSRGTEGLHAIHVPVILPRAHDCIAFFLGGHQRYLEEFNRQPGTYWFTRGFIENGGQPGIKGKHQGIFARYEKVYEEYRARYGEELARYLVEEWDQRWLRNYRRAAYVGWAYDGAATHRQLTRDAAGNLDWQFEELPVDFGLLERFLAGAWHPDEFLVVLPGMQVVATHDSRVLEAMDPLEAAALASGALREETVTLLVGADGEATAGDDVPAPEVAHLQDGIGLGLDAGGTYTDAVLYDFAAEAVTAHAKGQTTPHDPALGIAAALAALPADTLATVRLVSLATTFATNAIVEGRGCRVGLLLCGYDDWSLARLDHRPVRAIPGAHRADGTVLELLDDEAARTALADLVEKERVEALAIVGVFACRNPEHEIRVRELAAPCGLPVICGHELSNELGAIERATTAAINARIAPVVVELVDSVHRVLRDREIAAPLTIVRADGSLVDAAQACLRPVEMILSGPAASAGGAQALAGESEAIVVDMGGTTSDVVRLRQNRPVQSAAGAIVGTHRTTVRAPAIRTAGLGGDSHIQVDRSGRVTVGPHRVLPLSHAAAHHSGVADELAALERCELAELLLLQPALLYCVRREDAAAQLALSPLEAALLAALRAGPRSALSLSTALAHPHLSGLPTRRLEACGAILRCGLTPTDLLHADGTFTRWDRAIAEKALAMTAARAGLSVADLTARSREAIRHRLLRLLVAAGMEMQSACAEEEDDPVLARWLRCASTGETDGVVTPQLRLTVPVIGIGAPAAAFVPDVAAVLQTRSTVPPQAAVAGAIGAITGSIVERVQLLIRPAAEGGFTLHAPEQTRSFARLEGAKEFARQHATDLVRRRALASGAGRFHIRLHLENRQGQAAEGGLVYIETRVSAEAVGAPNLG